VYPTDKTAQGRRETAAAAAGQNLTADCALNKQTKTVGNEKIFGLAEEGKKKTLKLKHKILFKSVAEPIELQKIKENIEKRRHPRDSYHSKTNFPLVNFSFGDARNDRQMPDAGVHGPWSRQQRKDFAQESVRLSTSGRCPAK